MEETETPLSLCSSSSIALGTGGRFTVALLEWLPDRSVFSPSPSSSSPSSSASSVSSSSLSSSLSSSSPVSGSLRRFRVLEKISYVWQRRGRAGEALVEEFERKMEALRRSHCRETPSLQGDALHAPPAQAASPRPRLTVEVGTAEMQVEACHPVSDLRLLFAADAAPTHVRVFFEPSSASACASASSGPLCGRSFFSPLCPFTPPTLASPVSADLLKAATSSQLPPVAVASESHLSSSSSSSSLSSSSLSSSSSVLPRLFVSSSSSRSQDPPGRLPVPGASASASPSVSVSPPPERGENEKTEGARPQSGSGGVERSAGLAVPPGCGVGSQSRFRDLMAADKNRLAACSSGALRRISLEELSRHCSREDLWVALDGVVYDISSYVSFHPGGARILVEHAGTDISEVFRQYHAWVNAKHILEYNRVGIFQG
ncbi:cytochrome b5 family heme/steroid binding domain-containing protein [Toxoplasma gondii GAB2-2007-GAL-DOM2]|uniref:Cytochrome b5 family heme/steroid binding domain-containing protein n=2 Tax=Toxoplasma gondii TaxID=5811 RepID=A0A2T6J1V6_TOXGO|nr:cytochrome b5 family heme/steroid binding domain-containing protein [Toxoplasma gondii GAB2-2007-GAL-DOM2]PUA91576.1 cytochrome b5 family heme/steroid binding domain-containing protein [Toxoplasma gondii TgCATBr9]